MGRTQEIKRGVAVMIVAMGNREIETAAKVARPLVARGTESVRVDDEPDLPPVPAEARHEK